MKYDKYLVLAIFLIFSPFDAKWWNCGINYTHKIMNLQYLG